MATGLKTHLEEVLETHRMSHIDSLVQKYRDRRTEIKEAIEEEFKGQIYSPINSGSIAKSTAVNCKFDLDLLVPFKRDSYDTLEKMFIAIFDFLKEEYGDVADVREQKVSIGIEFYSDNDGDVINIDVVPARELNKDQYTEDNKLNLHINSTYGLLSATYLQTNIQAQIDHIKSKDNERKIIRLLKIWKKKDPNNKPYKSFFLELAVIKAFEKESITGNIWEKLESVMQYIRDNVTKDNFTLKDPGNTGNDVADTLTVSEKSNLSSRMDTILNNIGSNSDHIKLYFPVNTEFQVEEDKSYRTKDSGFYSTPPNSERFG